MTAAKLELCVTWRANPLVVLHKGVRLGEIYHLPLDPSHGQSVASRRGESLWFASFVGTRTILVVSAVVFSMLTIASSFIVDYQLTISAPFSIDVCTIACWLGWLTHDSHDVLDTVVALFWSLPCSLYRSGGSRCPRLPGGERSRGLLSVSRSRICSPMYSGSLVDRHGGLDGSHMIALS